MNCIFNPFDFCINSIRKGFYFDMDLPGLNVYASFPFEILVQFQDNVDSRGHSITWARVWVNNEIVFNEDHLPRFFARQRVISFLSVGSSMFENEFRRLKNESYKKM